MSTDNIKLPRLKIKEIMDNKIKIELKFNDPSHQQVIDIYERIRVEYFGGKDQHFDRVYTPVRFKYDKNTGEQNFKKAILILKIKASSQFIKNCCNFPIGNLKSNLWIEAIVDSTWIQNFNGTFILANIIYAVIDDDNNENNYEFKLDNLID